MRSCSILSNTWLRLVLRSSTSAKPLLFATANTKSCNGEATSAEPFDIYWHWQIEKKIFLFLPLLRTNIYLKSLFKYEIKELKTSPNYDWQIFCLIKKINALTLHGNLHEEVYIVSGKNIISTINTFWM